MHKDKIPPNTKISSNKRKVGDRYEQKSPSYNHEYKKFKNQENKNAICKIFNKIEIASDGNCLFRAILYCFFQNDNLYKELRGILKKIQFFRRALLEIPCKTYQITLWKKQLRMWSKQIRMKIHCL